MGKLRLESKRLKPKSTRGRKPTAPKLKLLKGNPGKRAIPNTIEPAQAIVLPAAPEWLPGGAAQEWRRTGERLLRYNLVTELDEAAFAAYCLAYYEVQILTRMIETEGRIFAMTSGYVGQHPAVSQRNTALANLQKFSALFGLNPGDRSRLGFEDDAPEEDGVLD